MSDPHLTPAHVLALAPDASAAKSARSLATPRSWQSLGRGGGALWGECQGSAKEPYRTQIDLSGPAFRCSCPSRKFPCKHGLGLMLLAAEQPALIAEQEPPAWVSEWLATRQRSAQRKGERQEAEADDAPEAQQRRAAAQARSVAARERKVAAGIAELEQWLFDQIRTGLAELPLRAPAIFDTAAARMVDAQAPGLARQLRRMSGLPSGGPGWQSRLLERMARLHLLLRAARRLDELPPESQADVRAALGYTLTREELAQHPTIRDRWMVLGRSVEEEAQLQVQRTWLWGLAQARPALILDFSAGGQPLDISLVPGSTVEADLAFYPGAAPLRAIVAARHGKPAGPADLPEQEIRGAVGGYAAALAASPWLESYPLLINPARLARQGDRWLVSDGQCALPIRGAFPSAWPILAVSAGQPIAIVGEWDGAELAPVGYGYGGRFWAIGDAG